MMGSVVVVVVVVVVVSVVTVILVVLVVAVAMVVVLEWQCRGPVPDWTVPLLTSSEARAEAEKRGQR